MTHRRKLSVNLASHPLRNRRFFFAAGGVLTVAFLASAYLAVSGFFKYKSEADGAAR